jgi:hypothetical protein
VIPDRQKPNESGTFETLEEALVALEAVRQNIKVMRSHAKWYHNKEGACSGQAFMSGCYALTLEQAIKPPAKMEEDA